MHGARGKDCSYSRDVQLEVSHRGKGCITRNEGPKSGLQAAEAAGKCWFIMTYKGTALKHVKMHMETACTCNMWQELQERFNNVKLLGDLQDLCQRLTDTVPTGPEDDDPNFGSRKSQR
jgi:hypothetical protein